MKKQHLYEAVLSKVLYSTEQRWRRKRHSDVILDWLLLPLSDFVP